MAGLPLGHTAVDWGSGALWLLAPAISLAMDLSPAQVGLLFALRQIGSGVATIPAGIIGDSLARRGRFLLVTFWWVVIAQLIASGSPDYWLICFFLTIGSAGAAAWHPIAMGTMIQKMPDRRAFALAIHGLGGNLAEILAPLVTGFLLVSFDWQQVLQMNTIPTVLMGLIFVKLAAMISHSAKTPFDKDQLIKICKSLVRPSVLLVLTMLMLHNTSLLVFMSMAPLYLQNIQGFPPDLLGFSMSTFLLVGSLSSLLVGRSSDRTGRASIAMVGLIGGGISAILLAMSTNAFQAFSTLLLTGFFMLSIRPVALAMTLEQIDGSEITVLGLISTFSEGVAAIGTLIGGMIANVSLGYAILFSASTSILSGLILVRKNR